MAITILTKIYAGQIWSDICIDSLVAVMYTRSFIGVVTSGLSTSGFQIHAQDHRSTEICALEFGSKLNCLAPVRRSIHVRSVDGIQCIGVSTVFFWRCGRVN